MKTPILRPATEAVLFGFERIGMIIRIAWLPIVLVIGLCAGFYIMFAGASPLDMYDIRSGDPEDMVEALIMSEGFTSFYILQATLLPLLASLIFSCVYVAATRASTLTDYEPPNLPFYFALGGREIRYFAARLLYTILIIVATVVIGAVGAGVAILTMGVWQSAAGGAGEAVIVVLGGAAVVWLVIVWLWVVLRFMPVLPIAAVENRIAFGDAWRLTKGNFWRMLLSGALFLAVFEGVVIVCILALVLSLGLVFGLIGFVATSLFGSGGLVVLAPLVLIALIAVIALAAFGLAAQAAWPARIYAYLSGCGEACRI